MMWRECMISIASAAMSYYSLRLRGAECAWWATRMSEWLSEELDIDIETLEFVVDAIDREAVL